MRRAPSVVELATFEELEAFVAELGEDEEADVFLAYRLGDLAAARDVAFAAESRASYRSLRAGPARDSHHGAVPGVSHRRVGGYLGCRGLRGSRREVRAAIARGDVYQVNLVQHLAAPFDGDPHSLAAALAPLRPLHPHALAGDGWAIVSASPELFLARRGDRLWTKPIKGTRPLGEDVDDPKDAAEHVMIVDLERNDLSRVCEPGTIRWPELMGQHELAGVTHLVSTVEGRLRPDAGLAEILYATFPGGSITGAPKIAALDHIARLEPVGRGASMGALGTVRGNGDFELALTIRTFAIADGWIHLWVGGGVVWDSDPEAEIEESWVKARPLLAAVGGLVPA